MADQVLRKLAPTFGAMYSAVGRPSIPPERLLKSEILIALYSVRSRRLFCERLDTDLLFRWFLDMSLDEPGFEHSTFSQNSERLLRHETARKFFDAIVGHAQREGLLSDEHFTVDGTLIESWASLKSLKPKEAPGSAVPPDDPGNPTVDFHGERRLNATHQSTTDPEARLARKGAGKEAKLCVSGHVLMENRHGLCVDLQLAPAAGTAERATALAMLRRQARRGIRPHLACVRGRRTPGLDGRTTRHASSSLSQRLRKQVEEIFGWMQTIGGLRKSRFRGVARTQPAGFRLGRRTICCGSVACRSGESWPSRPKRAARGSQRRPMQTGHPANEDDSWSPS